MMDINNNKSSIFSPKGEKLRGKWELLIKASWETVVNCTKCGAFGNLAESVNPCKLTFFRLLL